MELTYGEGTFVEGEKNIKGEITLSRHKLYLKAGGEDLTETYVPLEKVDKIKRSSGRLRVEFAPTTMIRHTAVIRGKPSKIKELTRDIVKTRGLKKKFLRNEWVEAS